MTQIAEPIRLDEAKLVQLAATGDTGAFEELCRRHAPAVWRFTHAVVATPDQPQPSVEAVREATIDGMARALIALERTPTVVDPYRSQAFSTILAHAPQATPAAVDAEASRVSATVAAFSTLPLQWRAIIWLTDVEGLPQRTASAVLGLDADAVDQLADRARAGFGSRRSIRSLRASVHPLPNDLVDAAWQRWQALRVLPRGRFGLVLGGNRTPAWIERAVAGAAATVIALGITGAVVFGGSPDGADRLRPAGIATEQLIAAGFEEVAAGSVADAGTSSLAPSLQELSTLNLGTTPDLSQLDLPPLGRLDLTPSAPVAALRQSDIGGVSATTPVTAAPGTGSPTPGTEAPTADTAPPSTEGTTPPPATEPPSTLPPSTDPPSTDPPSTTDPTLPPTTELPLVDELPDLPGTGGGGTGGTGVDEVTDAVDKAVEDVSGDVCEGLDVLTADVDLLEECGIETDDVLPTVEVN